MEKYGLCSLSIVPVRSGASDKSEMVSQLLFGEAVEVLEKRGSWRRIRCMWDDYVGWIDHKQIHVVAEEDAKASMDQYACSLELLQPAMSKGYSLPITLGATMPRYDGIQFNLNGLKYTFSGQAIHPAEIKATDDLVLKIARRYLYAPYLWGGRSPLGIDCSGFTQVVFKMVGISLPRDAYQQVEYGHLIDFIEEVHPGDLAFFDNRAGHITHVGIVLPDNRIIHSSGHVRIDQLDHYGIYNEDIQKYTHKLRVVKRVLT